MSTSLLPDQVGALNGLLTETGAFAIEISGWNQLSIDVMTFTRVATAGDADDGLQVRYFNISAAGTIRERAMDTDTRAAA